MALGSRLMAVKALPPVPNSVTGGSRVEFWVRSWPLLLLLGYVKERPGRYSERRIRMLRGSAPAEPEFEPWLPLCYCVVVVELVELRRRKQKATFFLCCAPREGIYSA